MIMRRRAMIRMRMRNRTMTKRMMPVSMRMLMRIPQTKAILPIPKEHRMDSL
jgi:hypothetical protein